MTTQNDENFKSPEEIKVLLGVIGVSLLVIIATLFIGA